MALLVVILVDRYYHNEILRPRKMKKQAPVISIKSTQRVTSAKAQRILAENGLRVTISQASAVVEFLYTLAKMKRQS